MGNARTKGAPRGGPGRSGLFVAAALALAAAGIGTYLLVSRSSTPTSSASSTAPLAANALALQGLLGHPLRAPECNPLKGRRWVYPIGPAVYSLPNIVANIRSDLYEVFAINYGCGQASTWVRKLSQLRIPIKRSGNATVLKGPPGYYCSAWPDANGYAYAGGCQSNGGGGCVSASNGANTQYPNGSGCKVTGGKKAFGWNWNVANRRVVFAHDSQGVLHLIHVSGSDTNVLFTYLKGSYRLDVMNTSGIGYLNGFTWQPSPGWAVTGIKSSTGAACSLTHAGKITCAGTVQPPSCLCTGDGGTVSIEFTAAPTKKNAGYLFGGSATQFKVTKMTPVPYLIPGTPQEAAKRAGV